LFISNIIKPWCVYARAFFIFFFLSIVHSQNNRYERIVSESIQTIAINGNQIFKIEVETHSSREILLRSKIDGEYQDLFQITNSTEGSVLTFQLEENPVVSIPDDKRNAHKVVAATLRLTIPKDMNLDIVSDIASVKLKGSYRQLTIQLLEGFCEIYGEIYMATVNTVNGGITVKTSRGEVSATSRYGKIKADDFKRKEGKWLLQSIRGDITVINEDDRQP